MVDVRTIPEWKDSPFEGLLPAGVIVRRGTYTNDIGTVDMVSICDGDDLGVDMAFDAGWAEMPKDDFKERIVQPVLDSIERRRHASEA